MFYLIGAFVIIVVAEVLRVTRGKKLSVLIRVGGLAALVVWTIVNSVTVVSAGHVGVLNRFGHVPNRFLDPGVHVVQPWADVIEMNTRTQQLLETAEVPSREGLVMPLEASLLFNLDPSQAPEVYRSLGRQYVETFVIPQFRSHLRGATASFDAKALYTADREAVEGMVEGSLVPVLGARGMQNAAVLLRKIQLPPTVRTAVESKLQAEQEAQKMEFVLQRERQEAERKRIEAQGIQDFQRIVSEGISDRLLRWKGIEATENLAQSENSKIVIVGGRDGLPLILNQ
jgi:regulator of protease activity HflC (stomatin/prohibitin superfamily)